MLKTPPTILIQAARAFADNRSLSASDTQLLEAYLKFRTIQADRSDTEKTFTPSEAHVGYLCRMVDDQEVFVPFNLTAVAPGLDDFRTMIDVGRLIHLDGANPFCLSGSAAAMGRLPPGADLDFCEYHLTPDEGLFERAQPLINNTAARLVWAKSDKLAKDKVCVDPWVDLDVALAAPVGRVKLDFVSRTGLGVLPTTTVVLGTTTGEDGEARQSFAYQEAIVLGNGPCRVLVEPAEIGRYIDWLKGQVRKILDEPEAYGRGAPVKALKRCLSLLLMLGSENEIETVVSQLEDGILQDVVLDARVAELQRMSKDMLDAPDWLLAELASLEARTSLDEAAREESLAAAAEIAEAVYDTITVLFDEAA